MILASKKWLYIPLVLILILVAGYFVWQKSKDQFIRHKIAELFLSKSDSLYSITYDSLSLNKDNEDVYISNIHIIADTVRAKAGLKNNPYAILDVHIHSLSVKGMHTGSSLKGQQIVADSIIIDSPQVTVFILRKVHRETKIDAEAKNIYRDMFHKLKLVQVGQVDVRHANITAINFSNKQTQFDIAGATIIMNNVKIDSAQREDTSRLLFCKRASIQAEHFKTYNRDREAVYVKGIEYSSETKNISLSLLQLHKFEDDHSKGTLWLTANNIRVAGINNYQVIRQKNLEVDSIYCNNIRLSLSSTPHVAERLNNDNAVKDDTAGFRASYGFNIHTLNLPVIILSDGSFSTDVQMGNFSMIAHGMKASQISAFQDDPMQYLNNFSIHCPHFSFLSQDKMYRTSADDIGYNSSKAQLQIAAFRYSPQLSEESFASKFIYQKDRYDISLNNILLNGQKLKLLMQKKVIINELSVGSGFINIYRDLSKPLEAINKVGSYPHQLLMKSSIPIDMRKIALNNLNIQYKERNAQTGKHGIISFKNSRVTILNVTNLKDVISSDNICTATFNTAAIKNIPLDVTFIFPLNTTDGHFNVKGSIGAFDMKDLNDVSRSLTSLEIDDGHMDDAQFDFSGNDHSTSGHLIMKYNHLKVTLLKKNDAGGMQKRMFMSLFANMIIKNENPHKGKLRDFEVQYDRDEHKSFFNLVWRTIFTGMKATVGLPGPKIK